MANEPPQQHISQTFDRELDRIRSHLLTMGGLAERQVESSVAAFVGADSELARQVREREPELDRMETEIDAQCMRLLALRQPIAKDLRLLLAIGHAVCDLERIGDEANRLAKLTQNFQDTGTPTYALDHVSQLFALARNMLHGTLDAFAGLDSAKALEVVRADADVNAVYRAAIADVTRHMEEHSDTVASLINVMWALRSLERVGDHARNVAEYIISVAEGVDVRHTGIDNIASVVGDQDQPAPVDD